MFSFLTNKSIPAQDWPNLGKYEKENSVLLKSQTNDAKRMVFMGDSITEGWLKFDSDFFDNDNYINRGIGGQTTPQMLLRFRADVINLQPKVVVILAGTNDIAGNTGPMSLDMIMDNIKSMCELAEANNIKVILSSVLPAYDYPWRRGLNPYESIPKLNSLIKGYADRHNINYLDYFSAMVNDKNGLQEKYTYDGVHPNKAGYQIMGPLAETAVMKALKV